MTGKCADEGAPQAAAGVGRDDDISVVDCVERVGFGDPGHEDIDDGDSAKNESWAKKENDIIFIVS